METTLENFTHKMCYDYFQAYDTTLICSLFVRIPYLVICFIIKETYRKHSEKLHKNNVIFYNIILNIKIKIIFYFKNFLPTFSFYPPPHGLHIHIRISIPTNPPTGIEPKTSLLPKDQP